jgi:basic amino acid/polyamine antiporter, APA family
MNYKYKLNTATYLVISNMIGTGIFTALFFQIEAVPSVFGLLTLWLLGGIVALFGGLSYSEISSIFPRSGGEYEYISKIYTPSLGFASGLCTLVIGFAAPIAGCAINLANYISPLFQYTQDSTTSKLISAFVIIIIAGLQFLGLKSSAIFQNISTLFKIGLVLIFIILPFIFGNDHNKGETFTMNSDDFSTIGSSSFFSCLALLYYAFVGWNSSIYISEEVENPRKNVPLSILMGITIVTLLYILINYSFLHACTFEEIKAGGSSIGNTVTKKLFGEITFLNIKIIDFLAIMLSLALLSTINSNMVTASRIVEVMGQDMPLFKKLDIRTQKGTPYYSTILLMMIAIIFVFFSDLKSLLEYVGYTLSIFATLVVVGVYIMRKRMPKSPNRFNAWLYPLSPMVFIGINVAMIYYSIKSTYKNNFVYLVDQSGNLILSPLTASVFSIGGCMLLYFILMKIQKKSI